MAACAACCTNPHPHPHPHPDPSPSPSPNQVRGVLYGVAGVRDGGIRATVAAVPAEVGCSTAD